MTADTDALAAILAEHRYREVWGDYEIAPDTKQFGCSCGWEQNIAGMSGWRSWLAAHDAHLAAVIAAHYAEREAQAWERGASFVASSPTGLDRKTWDNPYPTGEPR